jgi:ABC-type nickel/cobalt efflux system permease component RcnA/ABC-type uncharacterized transport system substrate-binding protein
VQAHPHVWVDAASEVVFDDKQRIAEVRHHWLFDEAFSVYALQGLDADGDGEYSAAELEPLARENVESLSEFDFFTELSVGDYLAGFAAPRDYYLELEGDRLLLHFTLPLAVPLLTKGTTRLGIFDPEYFVAFSLPNEEAVRLVDAPPACRLAVHPAQEPDPAAAAALGSVGADQRALPADMKGLTEGLENSAEIACGAPGTAREAADALAAAGGGEGDLLALPSAPSGAEPAETEDALSSEPAGGTDPSPPKTASAPAWFALAMAKIAVWQTAFNRDLTAALKDVGNGGAFLWLGGISFLYGIAHAAGPGHGKVVISSYLVANEARVRRGVAIAFIASLAQAVVAVALIGVMALVLNMTSIAITGTARVFEAGSFALVAALGLYLLARKSREALALVRGGDPHAHHHHHHGHHPAHHHSSEARMGPPAPQMGEDSHCRHHVVPAAVRPGVAGAAAAILSVGIRPCSGALVVLVFALAQGVFWAGVASTFLMALGTAITVAALAALAVGAKGIARRIAGGEGRWPERVMLGLELAAALFIALLGALLFVGSLAR